MAFPRPRHVVDRQPVLALRARRPTGTCASLSRRSGGHSAALARHRSGNARVRGGTLRLLHSLPAGCPQVLLLAGGVGITPLRTLFETLPGEVTLVYYARSAEDLALSAELDATAATRGASVHYVLGGPHGSSVPLTAEALSELVPDLPAHDVYLCGPPGMTATAKSALREAGVPWHRIHHESFAF